jgi:two-component system, chemotaxis family, protein-glutamate methylesterase/glutaminase
MKVMLVDDSIIIRNILKKILEDHSDIHIVGEASNGKNAVEMNQKLNPDIIIMDINMPIMNGLEATRVIMQDCPVSIMIFSSELDSIDSFTALKYGALEVMSKPTIDQFNDSEFYNDFISKLQSLSEIKFNHNNLEKTLEGSVHGNINKKIDLIVMGASTGGPAAVNSILKELKPDMPVGIVLVQHIEANFDEKYAEWLNSECDLSVRLAKENDFPKPGEVLIAPVGKHLIFKNMVLAFDNGPKVLNQKPSVNSLFASAANQFGASLAGVLLTGMGADGADGCVLIKKNKGYTIVQDKETSTIFGMPRVAIEKGGASIVLPLNEISKYIMEIIG